MSNQIINKALDYLGGQFAKTSIAFPSWEQQFSFRSDGTNVYVIVPCSSLRMGNTYSCTDTTWNFADTGGNNFIQKTVSLTGFNRVSRDLLSLRFSCPSDMTGSRYGIAVNRGNITITAN